MNPEQSLKRAGVAIPEIADKLFFSIREASDICGVEPHVLRYWETEFKHIRPEKRSGNRRFYRQRDIYTLLKIKHLLYDLNFTIRGAKKRLMSADLDTLVERQDSQSLLKQLREELNQVRLLLE